MGQHLALGAATEAKNQTNTNHATMQGPCYKDGPTGNDPLGHMYQKQPVRNQPLGEGYVQVHPVSDLSLVRANISTHGSTHTLRHNSYTTAPWPTHTLHDTNH